MIDEHEDRLNNHDSQLKVQAEQIKQLQDNATKLENVVMTENRETRLTITRTNQQLHDLINGIMGFKSGENQLSHNLNIAKWESIAKIIGILAGSGGIIWYIIKTLM